ncbi:MAG: hypothetical protein R8L07_07760 [Alphaproteobacteria bacterium]|nr:hypothetical protein [Alphaproteobacteria bacterium]
MQLTSKHTLIIAASLHAGFNVSLVPLSIAMLAEEAALFDLNQVLWDTYASLPSWMFFFVISGFLILMPVHFAAIRQFSRRSAQFLTYLNSVRRRGLWWLMMLSSVAFALLAFKVFDPMFPAGQFALYGTIAWPWIWMTICLLDIYAAARCPNPGAASRGIPRTASPSGG